MNLRLGLLLTSVLTLVSTVSAQRPIDGNKPLLYNETIEGNPALERDAKSAYAAKFHIIDVKEKDGFKRCGIKGIEYPLKDPRSMRSDATPGKISFAFIVTPDGRVIEPRILHSTDASVTTYILQHYDNRRFFPAKFRGIAVSSLYFDEWPFGGQPGRDDQNFRNGLNIMGYRDR